MRPWQDIVKELDAAREYFENHWSLPWSPASLADPVWKHELLRAVENCKPPAADSLIDALLDRESFVMTGIAVHAVAHHHRREFGPRIRHHLRHPSLPVRALTARALGRIRDAVGIELLYETKDDEHGEVKKVVVGVLQSLMDPRAIPLLGRWIGRAKEDDSLRCAACHALGVFADDAAVPILMRVIADDSAAEALRIEAAWALGRIPGEEPARILLRRIETGHPATTRPCMEALWDRKERGLRATLLAFARHKRAEVRMCLLHVLALRNRSDAVELAKQLAEDPDAAVRRTCFSILTASGAKERERCILSFFEDPSLALRAEALKAFQEMTGYSVGYRDGGDMPLEDLDRAIALARQSLTSSEESP